MPAKQPQGEVNEFGHVIIRVYSGYSVAKAAVHVDEDLTPDGDDAEHGHAIVPTGNFVIVRPAVGANPYELLPTAVAAAKQARTRSGRMRDRIGAPHPRFKRRHGRHRR